MTTGQLEWLPCFLFVYTLVCYQFDRNLGKTIIVVGLKLGLKTDLNQTIEF